jgi:hypothetical protein
LGAGIKDNVGQARRQPGQEIEDGKTERPKEVLDIVPENPEKKHVPQQVEEASVEEHRGEKREKRKDPRTMVQGPEMGNLIRDGAHFQGVVVQSPGRKHLKKKNQAIEGDNNDCEDRNAPGWVLIPEGEEHRRFLFLG